MPLKIILTVIAALVGLVFAGSPPVRAEETSQSVTNHGLTVYFGFVPSANVFELPPDGVYRIRLSVAREGRPRPEAIDLTYDHHIHGYRVNR